MGPLVVDPLVIGMLLARVSIEGPLPSAARKQTAKQLFTVAYFAGAFCRPPFVPLPSAVADGKIAVSCSECPPQHSETSPET